MSKKKNCVQRYTKDALARSKRFAGRRDAVNALLAAEASYTIEEAEKIIQKYRKGRG